jgi:hypothetical protein
MNSNHYLIRNLFKMLQEGLQNQELLEGHIPINLITLYGDDELIRNNPDNLLTSKTAVLL